MNHGTDYAPAGGWTEFTQSANLTDALWDRLSPESWVYLNLVSASSMWESRLDASVLSVHYDGERVVHLAAGAGAAGAFAATLATEFGLLAAADTAEPPTPTPAGE